MNKITLSYYHADVTNCPLFDGMTITMAQCAKCKNNLLGEFIADKNNPPKVTSYCLA